MLRVARSATWLYQTQLLHRGNLRTGEKEWSTRSQTSLSSPNPTSVGAFFLLLGLFWEFTLEHVYLLSYFCKSLIILFDPFKGPYLSEPPARWQMENRGRKPLMIKSNASTIMGTRNERGEKGRPLWRYRVVPLFVKEYVGTLRRCRNL